MSDERTPAERAIWALKIAFKYEKCEGAEFDRALPTMLSGARGAKIRLVTINNDDLWVVITGINCSLVALHADLRNEIVFEQDDEYLEGVVLPAIYKLCPLEFLADV